MRAAAQRLLPHWRLVEQPKCMSFARALCINLIHFSLDSRSAAGKKPIERV